MIRAILLVGLVGSASACDPPPVDTSQGAPSIRIIFPESTAEQVYCSTFMVSVEIQNFVLSEDHFGGDNVAGEGHWHLLDGETLIKATSDEYAFIPAEKALSDGPHTLKAELANNNHQPVDPEVSWIAEIIVDNTAQDDTADTSSFTGCVGGGGDGESVYQYGG